MRTNSIGHPYRLKLINKKPKDFLITGLYQVNKHSAHLINALTKFQNIKYQ